MREEELQDAPEEEEPEQESSEEESKEKEPKAEKKDKPAKDGAFLEPTKDDPTGLKRRGYSF